MKHATLFPLASLIMALGLIAGSNAAFAGNESANDIRTVKVTAKEFSFTPSSIEVEPGAKVPIKLVNEGNLSHNLHIAGDGMATETIQTGNSDSITLTAPADGKLRFFCNVPGHKQAGMKGELVVR